MNCFCGWNIFNDSQSSQSSHCTTPTLSKLLIVTWVCWVHLGHLALRFSENSGTRCWRRRWGPSSTVPVPWRQCAARGTCWRPPSDLEDLEAPSSPAQRWHGCRFGSDVSDVSCFGMFWKSLIFLDGHIVMQTTQTSHSAGSSEIAKQLNDGSNP